LAFTLRSASCLLAGGIGARSTLAQFQGVSDSANAGEQLIEHGHEALSFFHPQLTVMAKLELQVTARAFQGSEQPLLYGLRSPLPFFPFCEAFFLLGAAWNTQKTSWGYNFSMVWSPQ
jgi:hypothetical protein